MRTQETHHPHRVHAVLPEDASELVVSDDLPLVGGVLQVMGLDVIPDPLDDLGTRQRLVPHDLCEFRRRRSAVALAHRQYEAC